MRISGGDGGGWWIANVGGNGKERGRERNESDDMINEVLMQFIRKKGWPVNIYRV